MARDRRYLILLVVLVSAGCTSHKAFVQAREYDIGKPVEAVWASPNPIIEPIDDQTSRYIFEHENTGCRWSNTVDNETGRILSWQYVSAPDRCYTTTTFID
jgi:hypothetical protein